MKIPIMIIDAAQNAQRKFGVFASISIAQYADESAWGKAVTGAFNYFGIKAAVGQKATLCWTHEFVNGRYVKVLAPFTDYYSPAEAFMDHADLLATHPAYAGFMSQVRSGNVRGACDALTGVYATAPGYGETLWNLIQSEGLLQYDLPPPHPSLAT